MKIQQSISSDSVIKTEVDLDDEGNEIVEGHDMAIGTGSAFKNFEDNDLESYAIDKEIEAFENTDFSILPSTKFVLPSQVQAAEAQQRKDAVIYQ